MSLRGHIDRLTPEGLLEGWCWEEGNPERRVEVSVVVDGVIACSGVAGIFRADILEAGIGDGFHAFAIFLPWTDPHARRATTFMLRDAQTGEPIGQPLIHHDRNAINLDDRIYELEAKARQIESQLADVSGLLRRANAAGDMFAVVGSFFTRMAEDARDGRQLTAALQLNSVIEATMATHPVLTLAPGSAPRATICIDGSAPLDTLYGCIARLLPAGADRATDLVLLDHGRFDDVAMLPTVVRGLRYWRAIKPAVAELNELARASTAEVVVFLNGQAAVEPDWLSELLDAFDRSPDVAAVGGCLIDTDGLPRHGGLLLQDDGRLQDAAARQNAADPGYLCARPVDGLSQHAIAIRREALAACGYLDELYATPAAAMLDLCVRLAQSGWLIRYVPTARMRWLPTAEAPGAWSIARLDEAAGAPDLQRIRWRIASHPLPPLQTGIAAIIGGAEDEVSRLLILAQRLQDDGNDVRYLGAITPGSGLARALRRCGAQVVPCATDAAVQDALAAIEPDLTCRASDPLPPPRRHRPGATARGAPAARRAGATADATGPAA